MEQNEENKLNSNGLTKSTNEIPEMLEVYSDEDILAKILMSKTNNKDKTLRKQIFNKQERTPHD